MLTFPTGNCKLFCKSSVRGKFHEVTGKNDEEIETIAAHPLRNLLWLYLGMKNGVGWEVIRGKGGHTQKCWQKHIFFSVLHVTFLPLWKIRLIFKNAFEKNCSKPVLSLFMIICHIWFSIEGTLPTPIINFDWIEVD